MNRKLTLFIIFSILSSAGIAQSSGWTSSDYSYAVDKTNFKGARVIPPSPDAADLGRYGNVPVSLFTGTPAISIPLLEIKGNRVGLPINLSYNHAGFKPQDLASWIGLGWTLNAGGVITRSVMGNPDKNTNYFFANNTYGTPPVVNDLYANYDYMDSIRTAIKETQPDVYYYNFGDYSGKFTLSPNQTVIRKEKNDLNITAYGISTDVTGTSSFTIKDEIGNSWLFSTTEMSYMQVDEGTTSGQLNTLSYTYPSSWWLTSVTSADAKEQIVFTYYTADTAQLLYGNYIGNNSLTYSRASSSTSSFSYDNLVSNNIFSPPVVTLSKKRYLQGITYYRNGAAVQTVTIESLLDQRQDLDHANFPGERMVKDIKISTNGTLIKQYNFYNSYFTNSSYTNADHKRLKLDSVQEAAVDGSGAVKPSWSFTYNYNKQVPSATNARIDHWGFYNGADMVTTLVPNYSTGDGNSYGGGSIRDADSASTLTTVLTQIKYPTGGYTTFAYEMNRGIEYTTNTLMTTGGLRIKTITDYSFNNTTASQKNYLYTLDNGTSSGKGIKPVYIKTSGFVSPTGSISYLTVSASSLSGLGSFQGSHVGYSQVTEYQNDVSNDLALGRTVYKYNIGILNADDDDISTGDLLQQTVYDINGKMLQDELSSYNYPAGDGALSGIRVTPLAGQDSKSVLCKSSGGIYTWLEPGESTSSCASTRTIKTKYGYGGYAFSGQYRQLAMTTKTIYDQLSSAYGTTTTKYTYGANHTQPVLIEQSSSNNDKIVTSKKYAGDYTVPGTGTLDANTQAIRLLQNANMNTTEIEVCQYRQNNDGSSKRFIGGKLSLYGSTLPYLQTVYRMELAAPVATMQTSTTNGAFTYDPAYKLLGSFNYDASGNLNEQYKAQDQVNAYIWDYFNAFPVAEIGNAKANMVAYCGFESASSGGNWSGFSATGVTTGSIAGSYSYNLTSSTPLSVTGLPATRQYIVSYWSHSGTVSVSSNIGAVTGTAGNTVNGWTYYEHLLAANSTTITVSSTAGANIDELKLFPKDALMITYTHKLGVGVVSKGMPNNQYTHYTYDGFARLTNVKDLYGNIVQNIGYNYGLGTAPTAAAATLFYNAASQNSYQKQGCPVNTEPTTETYIVPAGRYASAVNQTDANAKATTDITINGQSYANSVGQCLYWNTDTSMRFSKNDCGSNGSSVCSLTGPVQLRESILYDVPAHTYSSPVSKAAAQTLAWNDVLANGQNYANSQCSCSCGGEGKKVINGVCQQGTRYNSSSTQQPDGTYKCVYYYVWSDNSVSQFYTQYGLATPCSVL